MSRRHTEAGFTAVELLITLFVAAAFLIAGYQLFNVVIRDGGQARSESRAGNIAYDYLQRYTPFATDPCTTQTPLTSAAIDVDGLPEAKISVSISCPDYSTTSLSKIEATITYGPSTQTQTVKFATYTTGTSSESGNVTDGLIGWWKFNGDAVASVGSADGTVSNATPTVGQNGQANGAYYFNGTSASISTPLTNLPDTMTDATVTLWVKVSGTQQAQVFGTEPGDSNNLFAFYSGYTDNLVYWEFGLSGSSSAFPTTTYSSSWNNVWNFWAMTADSSGTKLSLNGVTVATHGTVKTFAKTTKSLLIGRNPGSVYWNGSLDDLRIYDRALSTSEIQTLYSQGAK